MKSIISRGRNVREAIELGLELLSVSKKEVDIEIIQQEENGFMGIGKKKAVVKLTFVNKNVNNNKENSSVKHLVDKVLQTDQLEQSNYQKKLKEIESPSLDEEDLAGKAWIEDGDLYVKDSALGYATVDIEDDIQLFKNNILVTTSTTVITETDLLEIKYIGDKKKETRWKVKVSDEKLSVLLEIEPGYIIKHKLKDVRPNHNIRLEAEKIKTTNNTLNYDDVIKKLEEHRVIYGINHREIISAIETSEPGTYEIARGKSADPGKDGWLELMVDIDLKSGLVEDENGKINFREIYSIPTVDLGKVIGVVHAPIPGKPGVTVTNEPLPAKQTNLLQLNLKGIVEVDNKLVAVESGRPAIEQRGTLVIASIKPKLFHRKDVNLSSGNIRFNGDIEILGDVEESMVVEAGGNIFVHKSIVRANMVTTKSIAVKGNVISAELTAGKHNMLIAELGQLLGKMHVQLDTMIALIRQLQQEPAFKSSDFETKGLYPLLSIFLEKRFKSFIPYAKNYQEVVKNGREYLEGAGWHQVAEMINEVFLTLSNRIITIERLLHLSKKMKELVKFSEVPIEPNSFITVSDTINSNLYCSGDITIIGKGSINTKIHAGGKVRVNGILRGGEVYGQEGVIINELGSDSGTKTIVTVPAEQTIEVNKAHEGTVLSIGNAVHKLEYAKSNFTARKNSNDIIIFD
ncbi:flagellar assembly protein A [Terribacillus sp. JSM ZJ617]|uniref:flagellar assembly protein A n=1 Tax=Terribacillus sp. JSM ZJ617 TaxID=3342119 RepID=UPI0035A99BF2